MDRDIDSLVQPELNKRMPRIKDYRFDFKEFYIVFTEEKHTPQPPDGPTIGPTSMAYYTVWQKQGTNEVSLGIFSGQIPPEPQGFLVGKNIYYLLTYENVEHDRLYPEYFEISEKLPKRR